MTPPSRRIDDPHANALSEGELRDLLVENNIIGLLEVHPAVHVFQLADGRRLEMWDEGSDYGIFWEIEEGE